MSNVKMDCRLWSDSRPLGDILGKIGIEPDICHVPGRPMGASGPLAKRVATSHYATIFGEDGADNADVSSWLESAFSVLNAHPVLYEGIRDGTIKAVLWIAILARDAPPGIVIEPRFVVAVKKLAAQIVLEDYNKDSEDGNSHKLFFP